MTVRGGLHPTNIDENVRFRTTYYFRTFDYCYGHAVLEGHDDVVILPQTDSLYRFRMTGKAKALFTQVHFESGTLRASQIDPFGAKVVFDSENGGWRHQSAEEFEANVKRAEAKREFDQLNVILRSLGADLKAHSQNGAGENAYAANKKEIEELQAKILSLMKGTLDRMVAGGAPPTSAAEPSKVDKAAEDRARAVIAELPVEQQGPAIKELYQSDAALAGQFELERYINALRDLKDKNELEKGAVKLGETQKKIKARAEKTPLESEGKGTSGHDEITCSDGAPVRRGFQIMGPEGWRTFNQDERLLLAMSANDQPLISAMQQYSDRILNAKADSSAQMHTLTAEQLKLSRAEREFDHAQLTGGKAEDAFAAAVKQLEDAQ